MNSGKLSVGFTCLIIGLGGGYFIPRDALFLPDPTSALPQSPLVTKSAQSEMGRSLARKNLAAKKFAQSIPSADDFSGRTAWLSALSLDQLPGLFSSLCEEIGPDGLNYQDKSFFDEALNRWLKEDHDGALAWASQLASEATQRYAMKAILTAMLETDPQKALAMSQALQSEDIKWKHEEFHDKYVDLQIDKTWAKPDATTGEILNIYSELPRGKSCSGTLLNQVPDNFDFREFLDGIAALNQKDGKMVRSMPMNVLGKWAERDPQAAAQWFLDMTEKQHSVTFQYWSNIATAVIAKDGPIVYSGWAAEIFSQATDKQRKAILESTDDQGALGLADSLNDINLRDQVLAAAARRNSGDSRAGDQYQRQTLHFLSQISTPEARLQAITNDQSQYGWWIKTFPVPPSGWLKLGITRVQFDAALDKVQR